MNSGCVLGAELQAPWNECIYWKVFYVLVWIYLILFRGLLESLFQTVSTTMETFIPCLAWTFTAVYMDCGDTNEKFGSSHQRHVVFTYPFYFLFTQINNKLAPHHVLAKEQGASAAFSCSSLFPSEVPSQSLASIPQWPVSPWGM